MSLSSAVFAWINIKVFYSCCASELPCSFITQYIFLPSIAIKRSRGRYCQIHCKAKRCQQAIPPEDRMANPRLCCSCKLQYRSGPKASYRQGTLQTQPSYFFGELVCMRPQHWSMNNSTPTSLQMEWLQHLNTQRWWKALFNQACTQIITACLHV